VDLSTLNRFSEKEKRAEKHLNKFVTEIKRHYDFSDFQIGKLLYNTSLKFRRNDSFFKKLVKFLPFMHRLK